jgi:hypothetical protein
MGGSSELMHHVGPRWEELMEPAYSDCTNEHKLWESGDRIPFPKPQFPHVSKQIL